MDLTPILTPVISILLFVVAGLAIAGYNKLAKHYDWMDEISGEETVEKYVNKGIKWAERNLKDLAEKHGKDVDLGTPEVIDEVANYILEYAPKAVEKVGFNKEWLLGTVKEKVF